MKKVLFFFLVVFMSTAKAQYSGYKYGSLFSGVRVMNDGVFPVYGVDGGYWFNDSFSAELSAFFNQTAYFDKTLSGYFVGFTPTLKYNVFTLKKLNFNLELSPSIILQKTKSHKDILVISKDPLFAYGVGGGIEVDFSFFKHLSVFVKANGEYLFCSFDAFNFVSVLGLRFYF